ncbi:MAG: transglycosylase domain-containing protein [Candidatus Woesebacteria bacterium]
MNNRVSHKNVFQTLGKPLYQAVLFSLSLFYWDQEQYYSSHTYFSHHTTNVLRDLLVVGRFFQVVGKFCIAGIKGIGRIFSSGWIAKILHVISRLWLPVGATLIIMLLTAQTTNTIYITIFKDLPTPTDLRNHQPHLTTKIYDRNGGLLYKMYKNENRSLIKLEDLPAVVPMATVAIEDKDFFTHKGVSIPGITRAFRSIITGQGVQGGSTITQQLVKTVLLSPEKTLVRKIKEVLIALQVERHFSKQEILEMYLNEVSYGGSVYGIQEAANAYFGKPAKDLNLAQAAFLAGLPAAPSLYNPFGSYPERGIERQQEVLRRMFEDGKISALQLEQAKSEKLAFVKNTQEIKSPHFVMFVREQLAKIYGEEMLSQGGLQITTTLDSKLQDQVQDIVTKEVESLAKLHVGNGAAIVTNPKTGEILSMVGSTNYFDSAKDGQVNVTIRERQPGSSIKPVTYAAAFERGFTPATIIEDAPVSYDIAGSPSYAPKNYDGRFHGKVTVRTALASSYNIPAVKTEATIGLPAVIEKGRQLGITTWEDSSRFGLSLTLGGGDVKMIDMASVYGTFANNGITVPLQFIESIKTADGKILFSNPCIDSSLPCGGRRTIDERIAYQLTNILMDNEARTPAFGPRSVLFIPDQQVAVKTGTTNGLRDNWTDGYTSNRVAIVWVGNNDNSQMSRVTSGIVGASPIWNKIISLSLSPNPAHVFPTPEGLQAEQVCRQTGQLACGHCSPALTEYFLPGTEPNQCGNQTPPPNSTAFNQP